MLNTTALDPCSFENMNGVCLMWVGSWYGRKDALVQDSSTWSTWIASRLNRRGLTRLNRFRFLPCCGFSWFIYIYIYVQSWVEPVNNFQSAMINYLFLLVLKYLTSVILPLIHIFQRLFWLAPIPDWLYRTIHLPGPSCSKVWNINSVAGNLSRRFRLSQICVPSSGP